MEFTIDLRKTASGNAEEYYLKAKKTRAKVAGARKALESTLGKIKTLEERKSLAQAEAKLKATVRGKKKAKRWFESFRWFESSSGFLVVGGKDASSNEALIKKHAEKDDLIFHADVQGAPFFIVKTAGREVPEETLREAAEATASYSKAWTSGWGACDAYYVKPEQVSKTAESGEYLTKGAFVIRGTKNWFRKIPLKIAVGVKVNEEDDCMEVLGGPVSAVSAKCKNYVVVGVGDLKSEELAKKIRENFLKKLDDSDPVKIKIKAVKPQDIQQKIPGGKGRILPLTS